MKTRAMLPLCFLLLATTVLCAQEGESDEMITAYYQNPVGGSIRMGDPFIAKYADTYYLTGTTDAGSGFRMWRSGNLIDWEPLGMVFEKDETTWGERNFWAPELFAYNGKYYLAFSAAKEGVGFRLCLAVADQPEGPYLELFAPWSDLGGEVIDAHVFFDSDQTPFLYAAAVEGSKLVRVGDRYMLKLYADMIGVQLSSDLSSPVGEYEVLLSPEQSWETPAEGRSWANEGAFVLEHNGVYYMTYSANHYAETQYGIGYATAPHPLGPWTKSESNPIMGAALERGISGPGHNCFVEGNDGETLYMVYHAHADPEQPSGSRTVNIDPTVFTPVDGEPDAMSVEGPSTVPVPLSGVTTAPHDIFTEAHYLGMSRWVTDSLGTIYDAALPWLWVQEQGAWLYFSGSSASQFWVWDLTLGWLFVDAAHPSYFYRYETANYLLLIEGTSNPRLFYDYGSGEYITVP